MTCKTKLTPAARKARATARTAGGTFYATAVATVAANMYASEHTFVGQFTGFWTPVALFLSLEMVERVPVKGRAGTLRKVGVGVIALIAAWVSYWHLVHLFKVGGADVISAHAMPLTVDVLMAIARSAMVTKAPSRPAVRRPAAKAKAPERKLKVV
jgi:hypothetical protein